MLNLDWSLALWHHDNGVKRWLIGSSDPSPSPHLLGYHYLNTLLFSHNLPLQLLQDKPTYTSITMLQIAFTFFLQLLFSALTLAAPTVESEHFHVQPWHWGTGGGVIGFVVLILDIIVFCKSSFMLARNPYWRSSTVEVLKSNRPVVDKVLWCLLVFLFPIGGMIIYWLFSNRAAHNNYEPIL
jgi:hypothetical protein